eukprot:TRINITY_DN35574_c0_g1_i1.p1 TRINITY_DN35574_c0_g1~~TRINITY_DN35574_c0_g1_i1.p1  ORF type:complete len:101 (+),score=32.79 TRINITY_DN35574_c0_g1_i1:58-360(+)
MPQKDRYARLERSSGSSDGEEMAECGGAPPALHVDSPVDVERQDCKRAAAAEMSAAARHRALWKYYQQRDIAGVRALRQCVVLLAALMVIALVVTWITGN